MNNDQAHAQFEFDREREKTDIWDGLEEEPIDPHILAGLTPCGVNEEGEDYWVGTNKNWQDYAFN